MSYKFQIGDASLSGSVTIVKNKDILFAVDGTSDVGTAAKEVQTVFTTRMTASVGMSASAVYAADIYGNGGNITGISSETAKVTASAQNDDLDLVLVGEAGSGRTLAIDNNGKLKFNPSTNLMNLGGQLNLVGLSSSYGADLSASRAQFRPKGGATSVVNIDSAGFGVADTSGSDAFIVSFAGAVSASSTLQVGGIAQFADNNFSINADGDMTSDGDLILDSSGVVYFNGDGGTAKISCNAGNDLNVFAGADIVLQPGGINVKPSADNTYDLGASEAEWKDLYVDGISYLDQVGTALDRGPVYATLLSASSTLEVAGAATLESTVTFKGVADQAMSLASGSILFQDASKRVKVEAWADVASGLAGTVTTSGLASSAGVLSIDIANMTAATIATTDTIVFNDQNGDVLRQETVDDLFGIGPALVSEATLAVADDWFLFLDGSGTGTAKKRSIKNLVAAMADGTTITSSNGVLAVVGAQNIDVNELTSGGNANATLKAGMNYATASLTAHRTYSTPASPSTGDIIYVKCGTVGAYKAILSGTAAQKIDGNGTVNVTSDDAAVSLCYVASNVWKIF